jgi:hypothetical protein
VKALTAKVLEVAARELGVREEGGPNRGERVEVYLACVGAEPGKAWCAAFVSWCWIMAARELGIACPLHTSQGALKLWRYADPSSRTKAPTIGSIHVTDHGKGQGHVGIVEQVYRDHIVCIDGNSNDEGGREGIKVCRIPRRTVDINVGFLVPAEVQGPGAIPEGEA